MKSFKKEEEKKELNWNIASNVIRKQALKKREKDESYNLL